MCVDESHLNRVHDDQISLDVDHRRKIMCHTLYDFQILRNVAILSQLVQKWSQLNTKIHGDSDNVN